MDLYRIICPYCQCAHIPAAVDGIYEDGYQAVVCVECGKPFVNQTTMTPVFVSYALVGVGQETPTQEEVEQDIAEDPEELDEITESMKQPLTDETINDVRKWANVLKCMDCGKPISPDSDWRLCEDCLKDDEHEKPISTNSVFLKCPNAPNSFYRLDGDYVEVKYKKGSVVRTTWSDIHAICEEENPTPTIKELLGERSNTNNVAAMNAFVRAVKGGLIEVDV